MDRRPDSTPSTDHSTLDLLPPPRALVPLGVLEVAWLHECVPDGLVRFTAAAARLRGAGAPLLSVFVDEGEWRLHAIASAPGRLGTALGVFDEGRYVLRGLPSMPRCGGEALVVSGRPDPVPTRGELRALGLPYALVTLARPCGHIWLGATFLLVRGDHDVTLPLAATAARTTYGDGVSVAAARWVDAVLAAHAIPLGDGLFPATAIDDADLARLVVPGPYGW